MLHRPGIEVYAQLFACPDSWVHDFAKTLRFFERKSLKQYKTLFSAIRNSPSA